MIQGYTKLKTIMEAKIAVQPKKLRKQNTILFILYAAGVGWSAYFNIIWFIDTTLSFYWSDIIILASLLFQLAIFLSVPTIIVAASKDLLNIY